MANQHALSLIGVNKRYRKTLALKDVDLSCRTGDLCVLLGHSGAGKTSLLRVIAGLEEADVGEVRIDGRLVNDLPPAKRGVSMAFESYALYPDRTVFENMAFYFRAGRRSGGHSETEIRAQVQAMADMLDIGRLIDRYPRQLSGGQRQRVALGRALVRNASVHLLDEPIAHLDAKLRHALRGGLKRFQHDRGRTTIWATPDHQEAMSVADRIAVFRNGSIEQTGTPKELYDRPQNTYIARSLGEPSMNIFEAVIRHGADGWAYALNGYEMPIEESAATALVRHTGEATVLVGIRPSDIEMVSARPDGPALRGEVIIFEPLGQYGVCTVRIDGAEIKVKTTQAAGRKRSGEVWVVPNPARYHFFERGTETSIQ